MRINVFDQGNSLTKCITLRRKRKDKQKSYFSVDEVHCKLESDSPHVGALQGGREVEVEVQELVHASVLLDLSTFHVAEKFQEPLKRFLEITM